MAEGHRKRVKTRFLKEGIDSFEVHNVLELILFYAIPRKDTNTIAHNLEDHFGSFSAVLDASYDELLRVEGVTPNAAALITLLPQVFNYYQCNKISKGISSVTSDNMAEYLVCKYIGEINEIVYILLFDNKGYLTECIKLNEGSVSSAFVDKAKIAELIFRKNAAAFAIAHNHPCGLAIPSQDDREVTYDLKKALEILNVKFVDHYIIADNNYCTVLGQQTGSYKF